MQPSRGKSPTASERRSKSNSARVGVEEEVALVRTRPSASGDRPGEVVHDIIKELPGLKFRNRRTVESTSPEVAAFVIEIQSAPVSPKSLNKRLNEFDKATTNVLESAGVTTSPMPTVALMPIANADIEAPKIKRAFALNLTPAYEPFIRLAVGEPQNEGALGASGMHVHVSFAGTKGDDPRLLYLVSCLRSFTPLLLALSGSSAVDRHGFRTAGCSQRWLEWEKLDASQDFDLGSTRAEYARCMEDAIIQIYEDLSDGVSDLTEIARHVFLPVRPNFSYGTAEVRVCDVLRSSTERRVLPQLIAAIAQAVDDHDFEIPRPLGPTGALAVALRRVARTVIKPESLVVHPATGKRTRFVEVIEWLPSCIGKSLDAQGTRESVESGLQLISRYGNGAVRQIEDARRIHKIFAAAGQQHGQPEWNYDFESFMQGRVPLLRHERRALHLVTAIGAKFELDQSADRELATDAAIHSLIEMELAHPDILAPRSMIGPALDTGDSRNSL